MLKKILFAFAWICSMVTPAYADSISVACAANFTSAMKELASAYEERTGITVQCAFGSTGMLYGQIINGAPYDLFFAADERRPALLSEKGVSEKARPYATGRVVVWSGKSALDAMPNWKEAVASDKTKRVGIANPKTAPYGTAAAIAMDKVKLSALIKPKLAYGKNVGASFQYAYSGASDASFVALSQAVSDKGVDGRYWAIPEAPVIKQAACVLRNGKTSLANDFLQWCTTDTAARIMERYGYE